MECRAQFTPTATAAGAPYPTPTAAYGGQGPPPSGQPYGDAYVIAGYTRPTAGQQQGYYNQGQPTTGYPGSMTAVGKVQQQARPGASSTVYPTYSANTTGTTSSGSYAGFGSPAQPQTQTGGKGKVSKV